VRRPVIKEVPARTVRNAVGVVLLAVMGILWLSFHFVRPIPPRTLTMTTGMEGGSYAVIGERYRQVLARDRVCFMLSRASMFPPFSTYS
jgi:TRAP-type uncharacterized transport system substrate-binding protein